MQGHTSMVGAIGPGKLGSGSRAAALDETSDGQVSPEPPAASDALLPTHVTGDSRTVLARAIGSLVEAGFGFNSVPVVGVVSMQRAWQGPGEDLVVVDAVTLDAHGRGQAVREGVSGQPVWGPERGEWSAVVTAVLSLPAPQGYVRVAARERPVAGVDEPVDEVPGVIVGPALGHGRALVTGADGEEVPDAG
jgi:S1-C subfamily serine protease